MNTQHGTDVSRYLGLTDEWCKNLDGNIEEFCHKIENPVEAASLGFISLIKKIKTEEFGNDAEYEVTDYEKKIAYMGAMIYIDALARQYALHNMSAHLRG